MVTPVSRANLRSDDAAPSEIELIDRARQALGSSPATALDLVHEHERRFARGAMTEEREVVRIAALVKLGRGAEARTRGETLLQANPASAYARRVKALLPSAP